MKPAPFDFFAPRTLDRAIDLLAQHGADAKPLAGGQSLIPAMNFRLATPAVLVDLNGIPDLAGIASSDGGLRLGAMTRHRAVERSDVVAAKAPLLAAAMPFVAHAAIRARGTVGGSLAHADPAAELPAVMLALDARIIVRGATGDRAIPAEAFFTGLFSTALETGELLTSVEIPPLARRTGCAFLEFSRRRGDFALAGVAAAVTCDGDGRVSAARVALFGVGERAVLSRDVAHVLVGERPGIDVVRAAADAAAGELDPPGDIHASRGYRRHLAAVLTRRALERATNLERGRTP